RQPQRVGGDLELALQLPAAGGIDGILQLRLALEEGVHLFLFQGLCETVADPVEFFEQPEGLADAFLDGRAHVTCRVELRLLGQIADADPLCGRASPSISLSMPAMILSIVDLPAPFRPSTPILAPGKKERLMSRRMTRFGGTTLPTPCMVKMYWAISCRA